jgi:hypothetical protein
MCQVNGVMGNRIGILKRDDKVVYFPSIEAAKAEAVRLTEKMNLDSGFASFSYWAVGEDNGSDF